jgi:molybdenum cofactor cytidylyltransferase
MSEAWAILLAAGESSRMGQLKALLPWRGQTLLEHQVSALREGGADRVVVVLGHRADELRPLIEGKDGVNWVLNPDYLQGKTTSIKAGLSALDPGAVGAILLLNVDQPRSVADIAHILSVHRAANYAITVPAHLGKGGHPIVLSANLLGELRSIDEDSQGIKAVVGRRPEEVNRIPLDNPEILLDLNTLEQYRKAIETFAS